MYNALRVVLTQEICGNVQACVRQLMMHNYAGSYAKYLVHEAHQLLSVWTFGRHMNASADT